jgi:cyclic pyranopterin phosphate synthase
MIDVGQKDPTERIARARAFIEMSAKTVAMIRRGEIPKGDVVATATVAGIVAAKKTSDVIPLCHPLRLSGVEVRIEQSGRDRLKVETTVRATDRTGVEMEALLSATVACLTIYDMCKGVDRTLRIHDVELLEKRGGKTGDYVRPTGNGPLPARTRGRRRRS